MSPNDRVEIRIGNPKIKPVGDVLVGRGRITALGNPIPGRDGARWIYVKLDDEPSAIPFRPDEVLLLDPITTLAELA